LGIAGLLILAALPMLLVTVPGSADYPNHLARHHVFAAIGDGTALSAYFDVDWRWVGNLGVDLPVLALTPWLGVEMATRVVSTLIAPLTVLGILLLSRSVHGRVTASAMLALPFAIAQPFLFGFLNYCLSVALALIIAAAWNLNGRDSVWRAIAFGAAALAVWTAHIMGWAILLILVAGAELAMVRSARDLFKRTLRAAPLLAPAIPLLVWRSSGEGRLYWYEPDLLSSKVMNFATALKGLSMPLDLGMTMVIGIASVLAVLWAGGRKLEPRLAAGGGLLLIAALILPTTVLGSWGADLRLTPVAMMVAIMAIGPAVRPEREKLLILLGASLFVLRAGWTSVQWWQADQVLQSRLALLDMVPRGSRLGFLSVETDCRSWALTPDRKLGAYAITRRDAFSNTLFQIPGADLMTIRHASDATRWYDGSQDIPILCPQGTPDMAELRARMDRMSQAGFTGIWIAGLPPRTTPPLAGYARVYTQGHDTLLLKAQP
tara:strand:+ start:703 stop:2175 length:1473 start_codon:yes stop_codon:yes gene_type:complete